MNATTHNLRGHLWARRAAGLAAASAALALALGSSSASAAYPGENGRIAYSVDGDIRTAAADGSDDELLAAGGPTFDDELKSPSYSDDGSRIAYASTQAITIRDADGGGETHTINPPPGHIGVIGPSIVSIAYYFIPQSVALSPDGTKVAYTLMMYFEFIGGPEVGFTETVRVTTMGAERHDVDIAYGREPAFTPSGDSLVYAKETSVEGSGNATDHSGVYDLYLASATDPGFGTPVVALPEDERAPDVSPDGSTVVYEKLVGTSWDVWTASLATSGTDAARVATPVDERAPVYSPDGERIAYASGGTGIVSVLAAGPGAPATLIPTSAATEPNWGGLVPPLISSPPPGGPGGQTPSLAPPATDTPPATPPAKKPKKKKKGKRKKKRKRR